MLPPTPEALEKAYLEHDAFKERCLQWDKSDELYLKEWRARKEELDAKYEERQLLGGDTESWQPPGALKEQNDVVVLT